MCKSKSLLCTLATRYFCCCCRKRPKKLKRVIYSQKSFAVIWQKYWKQCEISLFFWGVKIRTFVLEINSHPRQDTLRIDFTICWYLLDRMVLFLVVDSAFSCEDLFRRYCKIHFLFLQPRGVPKICFICLIERQQA